MTKHKAIDQAIEIAKSIDDAIANGTLDNELKNISEDDWQVYVKVTKATLDEAFKDDPERAMDIGGTYNGVVRRRQFLDENNEL